MDENTKMPMLFSVYGCLLSDFQRECMESVYNSDLSLAEISENTGRTRQAARAARVKSEKIILNLEQKLKILEKINFFREKLESLKLIRTVKGLHTGIEDILKSLGSW